ncbi:molybdopterin oxidoreductase [Hymenobacter sp. GOD-10R]|uniref:molybdopterin oxidoreductase n=1 Tax=Hymenobacter sp. GOD-10R TaxID=3093922 RepID=UPI002D79108E|nr:molybdopterin oxidoreductase [Hymenobacter sp. GOD-10R]WRQ27121.1 molybdopterin oxidoreductase [Hymenobacter sp. GOD-10R]
MLLSHYLGLLENSEKQLTDAFEHVSRKHKDEPDIEQICQKLSAWSREHHGKIMSFVEKYSEEQSNEPANLKRDLFTQKRSGSLALLRDLHDVWLLTQEVQLCWIVIRQAALGLRDEELKACYAFCSARTKRQGDWLLGRIKQAAPQTLLVAEE